MSLTPEEARAVEAACEWDRNVKSAATPSEQRLVTGVKAQMVGREVDAQQVVAGVAIGYLDGDRAGFKRGVEAAANRCVEEGVLWMATEIRVLLAQEEESRG